MTSVILLKGPRSPRLGNPLLTFCQAEKRHYIIKQYQIYNFLRGKFLIQAVNILQDEETVAIEKGFIKEVRTELI